MELRARFVSELTALTRGRFHDLSPSVVSEGVRRTLGAAGAGLVMLNRLVRLPVGAAGAHVPTAEQLQVTLGVGPCLTSVEEGRPLAADEDVLRRRWPVYRDALAEQTPYRSTLSFPLRRGRTVFAALDVYSNAPRPDLPYPLALIATQVVELVSGLLLGVLADGDRTPGPGWHPGLEQRQQVFVAVGMVQEAAGVGDLDALALLRGFAFRTGSSLDDVAAGLAGGHLRTRDVLDV